MNTPAFRTQKPIFKGTPSLLGSFSVPEGITLKGLTFKNIVMKTFFSLLLISCLFANCEVPASQDDSSEVEIPATRTAVSNDSTEVSIGYKFLYDLNAPNKEHKLSGKLVEISGLGYLPEEDFLLANNDEQGKVFFLNKKNGEIEKDLKFHKSGDYEGVEAVDGKIYVIRNTGTLYEIQNPGEEDLEVESYKNHLTGANDVEGLGFDPKNNRLLIACKGIAGEGKTYRNQRGIYAFDLKTKTLGAKPAYLISRDAIKKYIQSNSDKLEKFLETFVPDQAASAFAPSGIAVHPKTNDLYVLSSVGKLLVVLNQRGKILHLEQIDKNLIQQPEGICFEEDGTMWISSEGKGKRARLFEFKGI